MEKKFLVGVEYFAGWKRREYSNYQLREHAWGETATQLKDWRKLFPERVALNGCFNDYETTESDIIDAAEHGIEFFLMLWYKKHTEIDGVEQPLTDGTPDDVEGGHWLNDAIRHFTVSPENRRMKFAIEYVNHTGTGIYSDSLWLKSCRAWVELLKHPRYFTLNGKKYFKIYSLNDFTTQVGGSVEKAKERLDILRNMVREAGIGEMLIGVGTQGDRINPNIPAGMVELFDFVGTYLNVPDPEPSCNVYPYEMLLGRAKSDWAWFNENVPKFYVPYLAAGWDPRPWHGPDPTNNFEFQCFMLPNRKQWRDSLEAIAEAMD